MTTWLLFDLLGLQGTIDLYIANDLLGFIQQPRIQLNLRGTLIFLLKKKGLAANQDGRTLKMSV